MRPPWPLASRSPTTPTASRSAAVRVPPHDLQAEESLLGAMMLSAGAIGDATGKVTASDFYKPAHGHIFDAIHTLYATGQPADAVTVADELRRAGLLDAIGGPAVLAQILSSTPATTNAGRYAQIVEEYALLRRLIGVVGRDRRARLLRARGRAEGARPRRVARLRGERAARHRLDEAAVVAAVGEPRPHRGAPRARQRHHRHAHRLPRPRPAPLRAPAELARDRRRASGHGQDVVRARHARPRRPRGARTRSPASSSRSR